MSWFGDTMTKLQGFNNRAYDKTWDIAPNWVSDKKPGGFLGNYQKHLFNTSTSADPGAGFVKDYYGFRSDGEGKGHALGDTGANALGSAAILAAIFGGSALAGGEGGGDAGGGAGAGGGGVGTGGGSSTFGTSAGTNLVGDPVYNMSADGGTAGGIGASGTGDVGGTGGSVSGGGASSGAGSAGNFNYKQFLAKALGSMSNTEKQGGSNAPQRRDAGGGYVMQPSALNPVAGGATDSGAAAATSPYSPQNYGAYGSPQTAIYQKMLAAALSGQQGTPYG